MFNQLEEGVKNVIKAYYDVTLKDKQSIKGASDVITNAITAFIPGMAVFSGINFIFAGISDIVKDVKLANARDDMIDKVNKGFEKLYKNIDNSDLFV